MGDLFDVGATLAGGRYRIDGPLDSGGMAQVYRAHDLRLDRPVAVKTILPSRVLDPDFVRRFEREAQAMAALGHPHVVAVHDVGEEPRPDGPPVPYFVMELVRGPSLEKHLRADGRLPVPQAIRLADQVLSALEASHGRGLVHRDIKPANILLAPGGVAKVTDFGIARALTRTALTGAHMMVGTAPYMAPEQLRGAPDLDGRCDLYAVAVVLFELVTGRPLFDGPDSYAISIQQQERLPTLASYGIGGGPALDPVLARALAVRPEDRYPDAGAMRAALRAAAAAPPSMVTAPTAVATATAPSTVTAPTPVAAPTTATAPVSPTAPTAPAGSAGGAAGAGQRPFVPVGVAPTGVTPAGPWVPLTPRARALHGVRLAVGAVLVVAAFWCMSSAIDAVNGQEWTHGRWAAAGVVAVALTGALAVLPRWLPGRSPDLGAHRTFSWILLCVHLLLLAFGCLTFAAVGYQEDCVRDDYRGCVSL
ncbi:serine/threonine-protein kinase [Streptomyces sp. NPDC090025]|uniref:serine/threonine-protein kinase n=1 Tax=Streptomyces sp. NPDC090025 TaxID=3365922 RepID=UPI003839654B